MIRWNPLHWFRPTGSASTSWTSPARRLEVERLEDRITPHASGSVNQMFASEVYVQLLSREVEDAALARADAEINRTVSPFEFVLGVAQSPEHRALQVDRLYTRFLLRHADATGFQVGIAFLSSGGTELQLAAALAASNEYFQLAGGNNNAFLSALFANGLGRAIDSGTQTFLLQALTAGSTNRAEAAAGVLGSIEALFAQVNREFQIMLGRNGDFPSILAFAAVQRMRGQDFVFAILGSSPEFLTHATFESTHGMGPHLPPTITSLSPNSGQQGVVVVIQGDHFVSPASVFFGTNQATSVNILSETTLSAIAPAPPVGNPLAQVSVRVETEFGLSPPGPTFQYTGGTLNPPGIMGP